MKYIFLFIVFFLWLHPSFAQETPTFQTFEKRGIFWFEYNLENEVYTCPHYETIEQVNGFISCKDTLPNESDYLNGIYYLLTNVSPYHFSASKNIDFKYIEKQNLYFRNSYQEKYDIEADTLQRSPRVYPFRDDALLYKKFYIEFTCIFVGFRKTKVPNFKRKEIDCFTTKKISLPVYQIIEFRAIAPIDDFYAVDKQ